MLDSMIMPSRHRAQVDETDDDHDDEGFAEGSEQEHGWRDRKGKRMEVAFTKDYPGAWRVVARREGIPPQPVVVRVVRELEDDVAHYKRRDVVHSHFYCRRRAHEYF